MFAALSQYEGRFERLERQIAHNAMQLDMIARDVQTLRAILEKFVRQLKTCGCVGGCSIPKSPGSQEEKRN